MKQSAKRAIHSAVNAAVAAAAIPNLGRKVQGYWTCPTGPHVTWELETVFEAEHGAGMFRFCWGVRIDGVAAVLDLLDLPGTAHATIGGDLGSLVQRKRGMTMLCLDGVGTGWLARGWWGTRAESPEALSARIRSWLTDVSPTFLSLDSRRAVAEFVSTFGQVYGHTDVHPDNEDGRLMTAIALRALEGDADWVEAALSTWQSAASGTRMNDLAMKVRREFVRRVRATMSN